MSAKNALIMVDLQNDFCPGGRLAVPDGDKVVPLANQLQDCFDIIVATQDWHPADHISFAANHPGKKVGDMVMVDDVSQILWPVHCVQHHQGAELHPALATDKITKIFHKGTNQKIDSYSAFFDNAHKRHTGLADYLHQENVTDVYLLGLATDYCVKYSALDAVHVGFNVHVIEDACRGIDLLPGDIQRAIEEMRAIGVEIIQSSDVLVTR